MLPLYRVTFLGTPGKISAHAVARDDVDSEDEVKVVGETASPGMLIDEADWDEALQRALLQSTATAAGESPEDEVQYVAASNGISGRGGRVIRVTVFEHDLNPRLTLEYLPSVHPTMYTLNDVTLSRRKTKAKKRSGRKKQYPFGCLLDGAEWELEFQRALIDSAIEVWRALRIISHACPL